MDHPIIINSRGKVRNLKLRSFLHKMVAKARERIMAQEDALIFKALDEASIDFIKEE